MSNEEIALKLTEIYYSKSTSYPEIQEMVRTYQEIKDVLYGNYLC